MIDEFDARRIASEWHGGQFSALYALASSGHIDSRTKIEVEEVVAECLQRAEEPTDLEDALDLLDYIVANMPEESEEDDDDL